jgi:hypothetical protein
MDPILPPPSRVPRGLLLVLGGSVAAGLVIAVLLFGGLVDLGLGAPAVRIDGPRPAWPAPSP